MEQNKDQIGAAVRGEAVALTNKEIDMVWQSMPGGPSHWLKGFGYQNFARAIECECQLKSARATDAPSEPSELVLRFGAGLIEVGQGHHGDDRVPAILFGRNGAGTVGVETEGDRVMLPGECIAALTFDNPESLDVVAEKLAELRARIWPESRATDALDSQPTDDKRDDLIARLRHQVDELNGRLFDLQTAGQSTIRPTTKQLIAQIHDDQKWTIAEQNAVAEFLTRFPNESSQGIISLGDAWKHGQAFGKAQASSQPTDGGVRNG